MTINKTKFAIEDEDTGEIKNKIGFIIDLITKEFPITITGVETKDDLKKYLLKTIDTMFDKAWEQYQNNSNGKYIYQFGEIS